MPIAATSYLSATLAFLILALLVVFRWRNRPASLWILGASLVSAAWASYLGFLSWQYGTSAALFGGMLEVARNAGWFAVLLAVLAGCGNTRGVNARSLRLWIGITAAFVVAMLIPVVGPAFIREGPWQGIAIMFMAIAGLVLVEQVFRNTPPQRRWQIKFLSMGLGGMFAFDLFLFADLVLFQTLDSPTWQARGFVNALIVPLIAISVARSQPQRDAPAVSRHLFFHTASLTGAGLYILAVGVAGYYLRDFGGELGTLLQVVFLFGAVLLLSLVLFSGTVRARLRVFVAKHFFQYRYDYRQEWLRLTGTLSSHDADLPFRQRAIEAIGELVESPGGLLWLRNEPGGYALAGVLNLGEPNHPPEPVGSPLADFLAQTGWVIDLDEYRREPAFYRGLQLPGWLADDPRYWAVIPLLKGDDLVGFVVLAQPRAPHRIDWEERDLLKTAGRQLAVYVALIQTDEALLEARQFETFHRLAAFLVHDLKNVSAQLSLIGSNAERHRDNPEFIDDAFRTVRNARDRLERTLAQLRKAPVKPGAPQESIPLEKLLGEVIADSATARPIPQLQYRGPAAVSGDREGLKNVLLHLVRNAQEATMDDGWVRLSLFTEGPWALIRIEDNGSGIEETFLRQRLFRPFQTTKGNAGMGIGLYEARDQVVRMGGSIEVQSTVGTGTQFTLKLPLADVGTQTVSAPRAAVAPTS